MYCLVIHTQYTYGYHSNKYSCIGHVILLLYMLSSTSEIQKGVYSVYYYIIHPYFHISILKFCMVHGSMSGHAPCTMYAGTHSLRIADVPDVVHLETVAKVELQQQLAKL